MFKKFVLFAIIVTIITGFGFAATEVDFMNFSSAGDNAKYLEEMKDVFEAQNPDIKINIETVGYGDYFTKLMTLVAGNNAPDAFELNYENFYTYAKKGVLLNINDEMAATGFDKNSINEMALKAFQMDSDQYGLPFSFSNVVLIYNKELFDRAGADYPELDWKWENVQDAAEKIRALHPMTFGIFQPIQFWEFYKVVKQNGGSLFSEDGKSFNINSKQNIETLQYLVDKVLKSNVMPNDAQLAGMGDWDLFISGRLGMIVTGIWAFPTFINDCDFDWDVAVEPGNLAKATHFFANGVVLSKDTKVADAAYQWIEFLSSSKEVAKIRIDAGWELPAVTYEDILADYASQTPPANRNAVFESMNYLVTPPVIEQAAELTDIINRHLEAAKYGEKTPEEALNDAQKELTEKINLE
jgi:multiple sugar transport system substrate-binding protein